jgi:serine/threonine protein kinase
MSEKRVQIGRFELLRKLGGGLQGMVYLAWDPELARQVALKVLTGLDGHDRQATNRVLDEARIVAGISHPNLVPLFEAFTHANRPVLVFEYVPGTTLRDTLRERGRFDERAALSLLVRVAAALKCAHDRGIVHLDLNPGTIMIDGDGRPRVMDFGLARMLSAQESRDEQTIVGTPRYLSPEHLDGAPLTPATDVFALGLLLYELLTGEPAFNQTDLTSLLAAVRAAQIRPEPLVAVRCSSEVLALLREMVQADAAARLPHAGAVVESVDEVLAIKRSEERGDLALRFLLRRLDRHPEFPAFSQTVAEVNRLTADHSTADIDKLAAVVMRDFSLTNRLMKIANSAAFSRGGGSVGTLRQAIMRLGLQPVRMIANRLLMLSQADPADPEVREAMVLSFMRGLSARRVAALRGTRALAEEAFICGLFHDLGRNLLLHYLRAEYDDVRDLERRGVSSEDAERDVLGVPSTALGIAVAGRWHFPPAIVESMRRLPSGPLPAPSDPAAVRHYAASYAAELCELVAQPGAQPHALHAFLARYAAFPGLGVEDTARLLADLLDEFGELARALGMDYRGSRFHAALTECTKSLVPHVGETHAATMVSA